jgi:hypothetical protein
VATSRAAVVSVRAAIVAAVLLLVASMTFAVAALAATTALVMGGTGHPLSTPPDTIPYVRGYLDQAVGNFISPASTGPGGIAQGPYNAVAVITPEEDWPNYGNLPIEESITQGLAALHGCLTSHVCDHNPDMGSTAPSPGDRFVVFGFSQSATIAMIEKARLAAEYAEGEGPDVSFVVIGAPRPNGGLSQRDTTGIVTRLLFGSQYAEWINNPGPTDTQYQTVNIALQYDGFADFPLNPLNLLATANAYLGVILLHLTYGEHSLSDPGVVDQGQYGDTRYYLIPADVVPLLKPVQDIPLIGRALADSWDPVLRVIIESAYDRSISPGTPTPFDVLYFENPIRFVTSLVAAVPVGIDNGFETLFGVRPLGTQRPGPYGVGGLDGLEPVAGTADSVTDGVGVSAESDSARSLPDDADSIVEADAVKVSPDEGGGTESVARWRDSLSVVTQSDSDASNDTSDENAGPATDSRWQHPRLDRRPSRPVTGSSEVSDRGRDRAGRRDHEPRQRSAQVWSRMVASSSS